MDNYTKVGQIKLQPESVELVEEVFSRYKDVTNDVVHPPNQIYEGEFLIIHLYPMQDTYTEEGELEGYKEALWTRADLYFLMGDDDQGQWKNRWKIRYNRWIDAIRLRGVSSNAMWWKDGSYCLTIHGPAMILWGQAPEIVGKFDPGFERLAKL